MKKTRKVKQTNRCQGVRPGRRRDFSTPRQRGRIFSFPLRFLLVYAVENANSRETVGGCKHSIICKLNRSATCNRRQSTSSRSFAGLGSPEKKQTERWKRLLDIPVHFWCVSAPTSVPHCATVYRIAVALGFVCCDESAKFSSSIFVFNFYF